MKKVPGFTIIELITIITIIGVLAGLLILRIGTSSAEARNEKRTADLEMVRTAIRLYKNDGGHIKSCSLTECPNRHNLSNDSWHQDFYFYTGDDPDVSCMDSGTCPNKYISGGEYPDDPKTDDPYEISTDTNGTVTLYAGDAELGQTIETSI
jgi:type II secretory pathway pseudopilin PulG